LAIELQKATISHVINRYRFLTINKTLIVKSSIEVTSLRTHYEADTATSFCETIITFSGERDWIKQTRRPY